jgi:hypothetical protein
VTKEMAMNRLGEAHPFLRWVLAACLAALVAAAVVGCATAPATTEESPPAEPARPVVAPPEAASPELIDPGAEPRRALRLDVARGDARELVVVQRMRMEQRVGDTPMPPQQLPTSEMTIALEATDVTADGEIHYKGTYGEIEVHDEPGLDPEMTQMIRESLQQLEGFTIRLVMTDRGELRSFEMEWGDVRDPMLEQVLQGLEGAFEQMTMPLPAEPVGEGARWRHSFTVSMGGIDMASAIDLTVTSLTDSGYQAGLEITMSAPEQEIEIPQGPPGARARLVSLEGEGTGSLEHDLSWPVPFGQTSSIATIEIEMEIEGQSLFMTQVLETEHTMREAVPAPGESP